MGRFLAISPVYTITNDDGTQLSASAVTQTGATLTLSNGPGTWYHRQTSPSTGSCSGAQTVTTAALTGLTAGRAYTWKAYSDSSCGTELASVDFTTLPLTGSFVLTPASVEVLEGGSATFTVALGSAPTGNVAVVVAGTSDFLTASPQGLQFTPQNWSVPQTVTVTASEDPNGVDETASIILSASGGGYAGVSGTVPVTIQDNDVASLVLSTSSLTMMEGGSKTYTVRLGMMPSGPVTVNLSRTSGSSTDVGFSPTSLTFNASGNNLWSTPRTVTVSASQDGDRDDDTATIRHSASGGGYNNVTRDVAVTVLDDDAASCTNCVWVAAGSSGALTEGQTAQFVLRADPAPTQDLMVLVLVHDAPRGADFLRGRDKGYRELVIPSGQSAVTFQVPTQDDATDEQDLYISAQAVMPIARPGGSYDYSSPYRPRPGSGQFGRYEARVNVRDNDDPPPPETVRPEVSFAAATSFVEEGDSVSLTVNVVPAPTSPIAITYRVDVRGNGGATPGSDFTRPSGTVAVPAGTSAVEIAVQTTDDGGHEGLESVTLRLSAGAGYRVKSGATDRHSLYIEDNDGGGHFSGTPVVYFGSMSSTVVEDSGRPAASITVTPAPASPLTVNLAMTGGSATAGSDYTSMTSVTVPAGQSVVDIGNILDDSAAEGGESFTIELRPGTGYRVYNAGISTVRRNRHTVHIVDDETDPAKYVTFSLSRTTIEEDAADPWVDVDFRLSAPHTPAVPGVLGLSLDFSVCLFGSARWSNRMSKTGANGYDYRVWLDGRLWTGGSCPSGRFEAGETHVRMRIEILDDSHEDSGETIRLAVQRDDVERWRRLGVLLRAPQQTLVILNDEPATLLADHPLVKYAGLAADARRYVGETGRGAVHVERWKRVLKGLGDQDHAAFPQAAMTAAEARDLYRTHGWARWAPVGAALAYAEAYFSGTIKPPPASGPEVTIAAGDGVTEGTAATFTLTADPAPAAALDVSVTVAADGDYGIAAGTQTVTIPTTGSATLTLATAGDEADEADGSVTVTVDDGDGYTVGDASSGSVAIQDDDDPPAATAVDPALLADVRSYAAETGRGPVHVGRWNRVLFALTGGAEGAGPAMTAAEAKTYADRGWTRWDPVVAALETLENAAQTPEVTIAAGDGVAEGTAATFTLTADPAPSAALDVTVTVAASGDYGIAAGQRTVTIPTAGSYTLTLATTGDEADEADGSVSVTVDAGTGYTVGSASSGSVAIADDDLPPPQISVAAGAGVTEGGNAVFTVKADRAVDADLAVTLTVSEAAGSDFVAAADEGEKTVTILDGETEGTLTVKTDDDEADEADGSVSVTVDAGDGYTVGSASSGSVAIADDDLPPPQISVAAKAASITEGGNAVFTVRADRAVDADLAVTLTVSEKAGPGSGSGTSSDFVAAADEGAKTVTILDGETEGTLTVKTVDDAADEPDGSVSATVDAGTGYTVASSPADAASVSVADNDAAALGPPAISVEDVTVQEGEVAVVPVRLSPAPTKPVRLFYRSRFAPNGAGKRADLNDFKLTRAWLNFRPGETLKHARVQTKQDSHDDGGEVFEVMVVSAGGGAVPTYAVATVTIENADPMPAAYLARFGRTVAEQALEGVSGRMSADRTPGMQGTVAGQALSFDPAATSQPRAAGATPGAPGTTPADRRAAMAMADIARGLGADASAPAFPGSLSGAGGTGPGGGTDQFGDRFGTGFGDNGFGTPSLQSRTMTARDALLGSSFSLTGQRDGAGGSLAFWGRASQGSFDGAERGDGTDIRLDGTVTTDMLGADYARGKWLIGLALTQSTSEGSYAAIGGGNPCPEVEGETPDLCDGAVRAGDGDVEASLTAAIPYAALQASERLKLWGAAGYGTGEVTLKTAPGSGSGAGIGEKLSADTSWTMAAAGVRGDLLEAPQEGSGPALVLASDALWAETTSEKTRDLAASDSNVTRLRLRLEGSYRVALADGSSLVPKLEIGARRDGGDAETGFGVELGGGIAWIDPSLGLSLDVSGRALLAHENDDLKDRGFSAALGFDPAPAMQRGPSFSLRQDFGGQASGGLDALFASAPLEDRTGSEATSRWAMEAAYGFPVFGDRFTGSPHVGFGLSTAARDYSLGWRLTPEAATAPDLSFGLRASRRESDTAEAEHTVGFEVRARW